MYISGKKLVCIAFLFFFYSGVSAIQKLCAVNTNITVKNVAVSKKHIKGTPDSGREKDNPCI